MKKYMLIFLSVITIAFAQNYCLTPNNELATCIPIYKCPVLMKTFKKETLEHQLFLKASICRYEIENTKYLGLCCGTYSTYKPKHSVSKIFLDICKNPLFYYSYPKRCEFRKPLITKITLTKSTTTPRTTNTRTTTTSTSTPAPLTEEDITRRNPKTHPNFNLLPIDCGDADTTSDRIFGGEETKINEFPWMVLLEYRKNGKSTKYWCAGSLINSKYILTAAHCIIGEIERDGGELFRIRLGEHDTRSVQDCINNSDQYNICYDKPQDIFVEETIVHPKYSITNEDKHYDIALVRLKYPAQLSETVQPICLPLNGETSKPGDSLTVAGWGYTEKEIASPIKLKAVVPYIADDQCKEIWRKISFGYPYHVIHSQFCAGGEKGVDSCQKDSGGPIMRTFPGKFFTWYQEGIVSFGSYCGDKTPAVYTRVSSFLIWILDNLKP